MHEKEPSPNQAAYTKIYKPEKIVFVRGEIDAETTPAAEQ